MGAEAFPGSVTNFPIPILLSTDADVSGTAQADADDIFFTDDSEILSGKLDHEIVRYTDGTGELIAWVKIPFHNPANGDLILYMYYGNGSATSQEAVADTWSNNFIGVYHTEALGSSGSALLNSVSGNDEGTITSAPTSTTAEYGNGINFDGTDDAISIDVTSQTSFDLTGDFCLEATFKRDEDDKYDTIIAKANTNNYDYLMYIDSSAGTEDSLSFYSAENGGSSYTVESGSADQGTAAFHHYVAQRSGSTTSFYIDGALVAQETTPLGSTALFNNADEFLIGSDANTGFANGVIAEVRVSSVARSASWHSATYNLMYDWSTYVTLGAEATEANPYPGEVDPPAPTDVTIQLIPDSDLIGDETKIIITIDTDLQWGYYIAGGVWIKLADSSDTFNVTGISPAPIGGTGTDRRHGYAVNPYPSFSSGFDGRVNAGSSDYSPGVASTTVPFQLSNKDGVIFTVSVRPGVSDGSADSLPLPNGETRDIRRSPTETAAKVVVIDYTPDGVSGTTNGQVADEWMPPVYADPEYNYYQGFLNGDYTSTTLTGLTDERAYYYGSGQTRPRYRLSSFLSDRVRTVTPPSELTAEFATYESTPGSPNWSWPYYSGRDNPGDGTLDPALLFSKYARHPWMSFVQDTKSQGIHPTKYMGNYWEQYAAVLGDLLAACLLPYPNQQRLLYGVVQIGIDTAWQLNFDRNMGSSSQSILTTAIDGVGRRVGSEVTPIPSLLAGYLFDDSDLLNVMNDYIVNANDVGGNSSGFRICYQTYYATTGSKSTYESVHGSTRIGWPDRTFASGSVLPNGTDSNVALYNPDVGSGDEYDYSAGSPYTSQPTNAERADYILWRRDAIAGAEFEHLYPFPAGGEASDWDDAPSAAGSSVGFYVNDYYMTNPWTYTSYMVPGLLMRLKPLWGQNNPAYAGTPGTVEWSTTQAWDYMRRWYAARGPAATGESITNDVSIDAQALLERNGYFPLPQSFSVTWRGAGGQRPQWWGQSTSDLIEWLQRDYWDGLIDADQAVQARWTVSEFAGNLLQIEEGDTLNYDATTSTGTGLSYSWTFGGGTPSSSTASTVEVTYSAAGLYTTSLTVTDGTDSDTLTRNNYVLVSPVGDPPPTATIVTTPSSASGVAPLQVTLDGSTSSPTPASYLWSVPSGASVVAGSTTGSSITLVFGLPGTYTVSLTVADSDGQVLDPGGTASVDVVANPPTLVSSFTASPTSGSAPLTVSFDASGSQGSIAQYDWLWGDGTEDLIDGSATETHEFTAASGDNPYQVRLRLTSTTGQVVTSAPVEITVEPDTVVVTATASQTSGPIPLAVNFEGSATGGDPNTYVYTWSIDDGLG